MYRYLAGRTFKCKLSVGYPSESMHLVHHSCWVVSFSVLPYCFITLIYLFHKWYRIHLMQISVSRDSARYCKEMLYTNKRMGELAKQCSVELFICHGIIIGSCIPSNKSWQKLTFSPSNVIVLTVVVNRDCRLCLPPMTSVLNTQRHSFESVYRTHDPLVIQWIRGDKLHQIKHPSP
jgi:hypothetical protein